MTQRATTSYAATEARTQHYSTSDACVGLRRIATCEGFSTSRRMAVASARIAFIDTLAISAVKCIAPSIAKLRRRHRSRLKDSARRHPGSRMLEAKKIAQSSQIAKTFAQALGGSTNFYDGSILLCVPLRQPASVLPLT